MADRPLIIVLDPRIIGTPTRYGLGVQRMGGSLGDWYLWALTPCCIEPVHARGGGKFKCSKCEAIQTDWDHSSCGTFLAGDHEYLVKTARDWTGIESLEVDVSW